MFQAKAQNNQNQNLNRSFAPLRDSYVILQGQEEYSCYCLSP